MPVIWESNGKGKISKKIDAVKEEMTIMRTNKTYLTLKGWVSEAEKLIISLGDKYKMLEEENSWLNKEFSTCPGTKDWWPEKQSRWNHVCLIGVLGYAKPHNLEEFSESMHQNACQLNDNDLPITREPGDILQGTSL